MARAYDPHLTTPVPLAFTAKMLLSLPVPGSAGKNQFVISLIEAAGLMPTIFICGAILSMWLFIHARYLRPLWPKHKGYKRDRISSEDEGLTDGADFAGGTGSGPQVELQQRRSNGGGDGAEDTGDTYSDDGLDEDAVR